MKGCPFCGEERISVVKVYKTATYFSFYCTNRECAAYIEFEAGDRERAMYYWNKRA
jgi:Lar family restriction alleviation protein